MDQQQELECGATMAEESFLPPTTSTSMPTTDDESNNEGVTKKFKGSGEDEELLSKLQKDIIQPLCISSPLIKEGVPFVYADHTASHRPLRSIESYIQNVSMPYYGNVHTSVSTSGGQSTALVSEARQIVAESVNAKVMGKAKKDVVLFTGSGATSAIELALKLVSSSTLQQPPLSPADKRNNDVKMIIFMGPYEHHSNMLPYRELAASDSRVKLVNIPPTSSVDGSICLKKLRLIIEKETRNLDNDAVKLGVFSAASNVTGLVSSVVEITNLLQELGCLCFWDYATAGAYIKIDMNPADSAAMDAVFISPHKLLGGVDTPGVLVIKKNLIDLKQSPVARVGGGTVFYTTEESQLYTTNQVERNEGGTPNVIAIQRAGLTFHVRKKLFNYDFSKHYDELCHIMGTTNEKANSAMNCEEYECAVREKAVEYLKRNAPNLVILGDSSSFPMKDTVDEGIYSGSSKDKKHLPILSFLIRCGHHFLHFNYVCSLLNDLFGIQSRGGCQCAGPYSQRLLGLSEDKGNEIYGSTAANESILKSLIDQKTEILRPGYSRLSLSYTLTSQEVLYTLKALVWVSRHGWRLTGQYRMNYRTAEWRHISRHKKPLGDERLWLSHYEPGSDFIPPIFQSTFEISLDGALKAADNLLTRLPSTAVKGNIAEPYEELRWFITTAECQALVEANSDFNAGCPVLEPLKGSILPNGQVKVCSMDVDDAPLVEVQVEENYSYIKPELTIIYNFRDGDFTGQAPLNEIKEGIESGELSESCEVFVAEEQNWLLVSEYQANENDKIMIAVSSASASKDVTVTTKSAPVASKNNNGQTQKTKKKKKDSDKVVPSRKIVRQVSKAVREFDMIQPGDTLLLGLSGGKDSLSLLHILLELQRRLPTKFTLKVLTIDPMSSGYDPSPLKAYMATLKDYKGSPIQYVYEKDDIMGRAARYKENGKMGPSSICAYCARMKRGIMYRVMREVGANKLVLAQHLDDAIESTVMSMFHNGFLRSMKANYIINEGDVSVIRPLIYMRESQLTQFALEHNLPVINENCPACFEEPKERERVKKLLNREEGLTPNLYDTMRRAILPLLHEDSTSLMWSYTNQILEKSAGGKAGGKNKRKGYRYGESDDDDGGGEQGEEEVKKAKNPKSDLLNNACNSQMLSEVTEDDLIAELARRRAKIAVKKNNGQPEEINKNRVIEEEKFDPSKMVCSLDGAPGTVPCYELM